MIFGKAVEGVLSLLIIGWIGYILAQKGWFGKETRAFFPKFITSVSLPLFLLHSLLTTFQRDALLHLIYGAIVPLLSILLCWGIGAFAARALRVERTRRGVFITSFTASNTVFVGIPVNMALFGAEALPYTLLYFFANTVFFWTAGNYLIASDCGPEHASLCSRDTLRRVFSMPMIGFLGAIALILCGISLPPVLDETAKYLGSVTTPLAILLIGVILQGIGLRKLRLTKDLAAILAGRFIISPLTIVLVAHFIPLPALMRNVFIIQSSLPVMVQTVVLAGFYKADAPFAATAVALTTLASLATVPLYMILLS